MNIFQRCSGLKRLWNIYLELGYNPWRKPRRPRTPRKPRKEKGGVYMGTRDAIPFLNDDAKRTFSHLLLRPGYMMRDYILRGQHERHMAPFTALLVFYSLFTLIVAVVQPGAAGGKFGASLINGLEDTQHALEHAASFSNADTLKTKQVGISLIGAVRQTILLTHLDLYPDAVDTPWKASLSAVENSLRNKGIPLFLGNFLILWAALALLLRKYPVSVSGAAAASAYIQCQYCIFMFLALLLSFGGKTELGLLLMGVLLFFDFMQMLGVNRRKALALTIRTGLIYLAILVLFYILLGGGLLLFAFHQAA